MTTTMQKWGNSTGIRIPKKMLDSVNWSENEPVTIFVQGDKMIIQSARRKKSIKELFEGYDEDYIPKEVDWGKPEGKEVW